MITPVMTAPVRTGQKPGLTTLIAELPGSDPDIEASTQTMRDFLHGFANLKAQYCSVMSSTVQH